MTDHATVEYAIGSLAEPKAVWNVGSATLTTVMSRMDMIGAEHDHAGDLQDGAIDVVGEVGQIDLAIGSHGVLLRARYFHFRSAVVAGVAYVHRQRCGALA